MGKRILFVYNTSQPFVKMDLEILKERWDVQESFERKAYQINPFRILRSVQDCDLVFSWFASWHSLLPVLFARMLNKPSIVVIGGYDTANLPEANYGSQRGGVRRYLASTVIKHATHLIVNSRYIYTEVLTNIKIKPQKLSIIYHGLYPWRLGEDTRDRLILTVGGIWQENLLRKGLLPFVQSAKYIPDAQFILVGKWNDDSINKLRSEASNNVEFKGYITDKELERLYAQAAVYVQASLHEGFGLSVAEAMSAGCIPVVTKMGALPEVVGNTGIYTNSNDPKDIADAIQKALMLDKTVRHKVRERIITEFPLDKRREDIFALISNMLNSSKNEFGV